MYGYIYKTTNIKNNKVYVGQNRGKVDKNYFGSGSLIKKAIKRQGKKLFKLEVIAIVDNEDQLNEFERFLIAKYREILGNENVYNITGGSKTPPWNTGKPHPEETRKKIGLKSIGRKTFLGRKHTPESIEKMRSFRLGRKESQETKDKLSIVHKGRKHSVETINRMKEIKKLWWDKKKGLINEAAIL